MGISIEQWRCKIGCFSQPNKFKTRVNVIHVHLTTGLKSGLRLVICLAAILILCGDVEQNPGPPKSSTDGARRKTPRRQQAPVNASNEPTSVSIEIFETNLNIVRQFRLQSIVLIALNLTNKHKCTVLRFYLWDLWYNVILSQQLFLLVHMHYNDKTDERESPQEA